MSEKSPADRLKLGQDRLVAVHASVAAAGALVFADGPSLPPGALTIRAAYVGAYTDGSKCDVWLDIATANWSAPQKAEIDLWLVAGSQHKTDASGHPTGDVVLLDYQHIEIWPGDVAHYHVGALLAGSGTLQLVNNGPIPVVLDLHRQPA